MKVTAIILLGLFLISLCGCGQTSRSVEINPPHDVISTDLDTTDQEVQTICDIDNAFTNQESLIVYKADTVYLYAINTKARTTLEAAQLQLITSRNIGTAIAVAFSENTLAVLKDATTVELYDVSNSTNIRYVTQFTVDGSEQMYLQHGLLIVKTSNIWGTASVYSVKDPTSPRFIDTISHFEDICVDPLNHRIYYVNYFDVVIYTYSDTSLSYIGGCSIYRSWRITFKGTTVFVVGYDGSAYVVDFTTISAPQCLAYVNNYYFNATSPCLNVDNKMYLGGVQVADDLSVISSKGYGAQGVFAWGNYMLFLNDRKLTVVKE